MEEQKDKVVEQGQEESTKEVNKELEATRKKEDNDTGKVYEYGDLTVTCGACGHVQHIQKSIKGGVQLPSLYTVEKAHLTIACEECKNWLKLHFVETAPEDIIRDENIDSDDVQEESKEQV